MIRSKTHHQWRALCSATNKPGTFLDGICPGSIASLGWGMKHRKQAL